MAKRSFTRATLMLYSLADAARLEDGPLHGVPELEWQPGRHDLGPCACPDPGCPLPRAHEEVPPQ